MTDIELLPLPNSGSGFYEDNVRHDTFSKRQMEACARTNMEPLIAENERLRAERDSFQRVGIAAQARAVRLEAALRASLEAVQSALQEAYHSAGQECCGKGGMHGCCGVPEAVWTPEDQAVMDKLAPIERLLNAALREYGQESGNG